MSDRCRAPAAEPSLATRKAMDETKRRLILHMSVSLDGFVARRDGVIDWLGDERLAAADHDARRHRANLELLGQIGSIVMGSGAYADFYGGWSGSDGPMAVLMNGLPKVVFSQSLSVVKWNNARLVQAPLEEEIPRLKSEGGKDLVVFGGARIAHSLMANRLIDEYRLTVQPVALGEGLPLMHGLREPQRLELVSSTVYADGCVAQVFKPTSASHTEGGRPAVRDDEKEHP